MPKNQHGKDKMYLTRSEWRELGGKKKQALSGVKHLPFYCCALTFQPFTTPVYLHSSVYDFVNIVPYLKQHGTDPVSGNPASVDDLVRLNFSKNSKGKFHDPVSFKEFSDHSHIVAVKSSGNVYAYETVKSLNIVPNNWTDLLTNQPFTRADILEIQNPDVLKRKRYEDFDHTKRKSKSLKMPQNPAKSAIQTNATADRILVQARKLEKQREMARDSGQSSSGSAAKVEGAKVKSRHTTGMMAASFTSTAVDVVTENEYAEAGVDEANDARWRRLRKMKKKGYIRFATNLGNLNIELHFDASPQACENFITLTERGYYNNTTFHRKVPNFMVQGGDPSGTGKGGDSIWGGAFKDEIQTRYTHSSRGVVAMANSGPNTNKSQFYITFGPCPHLDKKHTVIGKLVGGFDTLDEIEVIPTDAHCKPKRKITILNSFVFVNPVAELQAAIRKEKLEEEEEKKRAEQLKEIERKAQERARIKQAAAGTKHKGVGRYLTMPKPSAKLPKEASSSTKSKSKPAAWSFESW